jgi:hypothetical protein
VLLMQPNPHKTDQPKKPALKEWVPQAKRTADSVKKLKTGVDQLKPWAVPLSGKQPHRTEIPYRILPLLQGLKRRPMPRDAILHALTESLFDHTFDHARGCKINLEDAWQQVMCWLQNSRPDAVQWLNSTESKSAFFWQIAGHVSAIRHPVKDDVINVLFYQRNQGPRKGELVPFFEFGDGSTIQIPKNWQPDWPLFLVAGSYFGREPVCNFTVANMCFSWPCSAVEQILKSILWEPPLRVFRERKKKKQR